MTGTRFYAQERWAIWSSEGAGYLPPIPVGRLPKAAELSGDKNWATIFDGTKIETVYVRLDQQERKHGNR